MDRHNNRISHAPGQDTARLQVMAVILVLVGVLFGARLFYLQVIKGAEYRAQANSGQTKSLVIEASRGQIFATQDGQKVPLVLNERKWLLFSDSAFIEDQEQIETVLSQNGIPLTSFQKQELRTDNRYIVLAKLLDDDVRQSIVDSQVKGLYFQEQNARTYTEGSLAAHALGFVDADGQGRYGVEQYFQQELTGQDGQLKAITDVSGVPLAFEKDNIAQEPVNGQDISLTIDIGVQQIVEAALQDGVDSTQAQGASAVVLDADTGAVLAMANYPTFDPADFRNVEDLGAFANRAVSDTIEPGSVMKTLVAAAALDRDVVGVDSTYYDQNQVVLDGATVTNALDYGAQERTVTDILSNSLNTGSIYLLSRLGGGEVNQQARVTYYDYLTTGFGLGSKTGITLPSEASGTVFGPNDGFGLNIRYANMTFGQGLTVTPLQIAAAYASLVNGGNLYKPYIVSAVGDSQTRPELVGKGPISEETSEEVRELLTRVGQINYPSVQTPGLEVSGKTGTAEIADGQGGYLTDDFTGTFAGYVKSGQKTLAMMLWIDRPQDVRFAGSGAAAPIWQDMVSNLINTGKVN